VSFRLQSVRKGAGKSDCQVITILAFVKLKEAIKNGENHMDNAFLFCFRLYLIKRMALMLIDGIIFFEMVVS
jgi:hypothetical protein